MILQSKKIIDNMMMRGFTFDIDGKQFHILYYSVLKTIFSMMLMEGEKFKQEVLSIFKK